jgi:branched-subunit amino acid ABC-type transport system permease component
MSFTTGVVFDLLSSVSALLLAALGLYIIYGVMRTINMAHGEFLMLGAYTCSIVHDGGWNFWVGALAAAAVVGLLGAIVERFVLRSLYGRNDLSTLLATWGLSMFLIEGIRLIFGPSGRFIDPPASTVISVAGTPFPLYSLIILLITLTLLATILYIMYGTKAGLIMRAAVENRDVAEGFGIRVESVYRWTFIAGSALAGLSGALLAPAVAVTPQMGIDYGWRCFLVVITGGFGSLASPVLGAIIVGGSKSLLNSYFGITTSTIGGLSMVLLILLIRPSGIVGRS